MVKQNSRLLRAVVAGAALVLLAAAPICGQDGKVLFSAMEDELARSMAQLQMENLDKPYFIAYTIDDFQEMKINGSLGALTGSDLARSRFLTVDVRVGDYALDNSNFVSGFNFGTNPRPMALDNDYDAVRHEIYMTTDAEYKSALQTLAKKKAYLQARVIKDRPEDFFRLPANTVLDKEEAFDLDRARFEEFIRAASAVFRDYPTINSSNIELKAAVTNQYFVASNGSRTLRGDRLYVLRLTMTGIGQDGENITDGDQVIVNAAKNIPDREQLVRWAKDNAERMKALVAAGTVEEYTGPVIFAGDAAGEFFRQLFIKNVSNNPPPVYENEQMAALSPNPEFGNKIKRRVLPAFFDVYDDPTATQVDKENVVGAYDVDDAGSVPVKIQLVDKGKLVGLPIGTAPTKKIKEPNGHARGASGKPIAARPSNVIITSGDQVPFDRLKQTMLELCQDVDLEYGLIIRKVAQTDATRQLLSLFMGGGQSGQQSTLEPALEAYKVYPDGREEPVHSLEFVGVTARTLLDILQTGDQRRVYNYLIGDDYEMPVSIVCPAILVEEMELKKSEEKTVKPPVLPSPLAGK